MDKQLEGQMSIFDFIPEPKAVDKWALPCDTCKYDVKGCCAYNMPLGDFCRLGDKWEPKEIDEKDDYIKENPTCFYVLGHYLDRQQGWHKMPEELPTFSKWHLIDVVLFGKKTGTAWMEHEKWQAQYWAFRSIDDRRNAETTEVLAWKLSEQEEQKDE